MLKLLIVEDDMTIRRGLVESVQWKEYGIEIVGEAHNGRIALEIINSKHVDIVLTDVAMPQMDGIELVSRIRETNASIKIVFVSGHSDLLYLKEAFKLDVLDYIIKPVIMDELDSVIKKITGICTKEKEQQENLEELRSKLEESMPVLRERFIAMLLKRSIADTEYVERRIRFLGLPFEQKDRFTVISIDLGELDNKGVFYEELEKHELQLQSIHETLKNITGQYYSFSLMVDEHVIALLLSTKNEWKYDQVIGVAQKIQQAIVRQIGSIPAIGIGMEVAGVCEICLSYVQSRKALEHKYFLGVDAVIHINDMENANIKTGIDISDIEGKIIEAIRKGNRIEAETEIDGLFGRLRKIKHLNMQYVRNVCLELTVLAEKKFLELKVSASLKEDSSFSWEELLYLKTLDETYLCMRMKFGEMADDIKALQSNTTGNLARMIMKVLNERFGEDITIHTLAEEFYITSNYVCLLFKKETGKTVNEYLTEVRMERSRKLLKDPVLKVYEIAEMVGYKDVDYFGKLFKKYSGLTVTQYRNKRLE